MPEDSKKNQQKAKNEPKEQRRRRGKQHPGPIEKKIEKEPETPKAVVPEKPSYEPPPPEFYTSLKRETDEILKITEEANAKYKKKEIQSNWAKYEMPIESYEEIDEQENLGADYEALIQAPLTVGGHFQFKHEKSWDITTGPSPYDKYFDINMDSLNIALSTIPFYERNNIEISFFNESDIQSMVHRATKFKQKYYNDPKFTTPDLEAQNKILTSLKSDSKDITNTIEIDEVNEAIKNNDKMLNKFKDIKLEDCEKESEQITCNELVENKEEEYVNPIIEPTIVFPEKQLPDNLPEYDNQINKIDKETELEILEKPSTEAKENSYKDIKNKTIVNDVDEFLQVKTINDKETFKEVIKKEEKPEIDIKNKTIVNEVDEFLQDKAINDKDTFKEDIKKQEKPEIQLQPVDIIPKEKKSPKMPTPQVEPTKNPIIESPEDLEKWLDDFLDG